MTVHDYMGSVKWEIALIGIPLAHWTTANINELFDLKADKEFRVGASLTGELVDLPPEKLRGIPQAIERLNDFYFYELAFEAKAKMVSGDYIGALLLAVAALEGYAQEPSSRASWDRSCPPVGLETTRTWKTTSSRNLAFRCATG